MNLIEKIDLNIKRRGRQSFLYPISQSIYGYIETDANRSTVRWQYKGRRVLDSTPILCVHTLYYAKHSVGGRGKDEAGNKIPSETNSYFYYTDGCDLFRVNYTTLVRHYRRNVSSTSNPILEICRIIRENALTHEVMSFFCL